MASVWVLMATHLPLLRFPAASLAHSVRVYKSFLVMMAIVNSWFCLWSENRISSSFFGARRTDLRPGGHASPARRTQGLLPFRAKTRHRVVSRDVFHSDVVIEPPASKALEDVRVVDLAGVGLVPPGDVGDMAQPQLVDVLLQLFDQVTLRDLLVKEIIEKLHLRVPDFLDNLEPFRHRLEVVLGVLLGVDVFQQ